MAVTVRNKISKTLNQSDRKLAFINKLSNFAQNISPFSSAPIFQNFIILFFCHTYVDGSKHHICSLEKAPDSDTRTKWHMG
jgi:hypothetical protein